MMFGSSVKTFKFERQPFCRHCGEAIARSTMVEFFWNPRDGGSSDLPVAYSKEEVQRRHNQLRVLNVKMSWDMEHEKKYVSRATYWDGESYADPLFCKEICANRFGRLMAANGKTTIAYQEALKNYKPPMMEI